ncbi:stalk domain-containing protein [Cohnella fermenti]|nr:stalk domain-containing protein [Cohnella fermenti]
MRYKMGIALAAILLFVTTYSFAFAQTDSSIGIKLNDQTLALSQQPYAENGAVMIPLRGVFEKLGLSVDWTGTVYRSGDEAGRYGSGKRNDHWRSFL